jgi:hypothetical protein
LQVVPAIARDGARLRVHAYGPADGQVQHRTRSADRRDHRRAAAERPLPLLKRRIPLPFFIGRLGLGSPIVFLPPAPPVHSERIVEMLSETGSLVRY